MDVVANSLWRALDTEPKSERKTDEINIRISFNFTRQQIKPNSIETGR